MEEFKFLSYKIETSTARGVKIIFAYNHHHLSTKQESLTRKKNQANKILFFYFSVSSRLFKIALE